MSSGSDTSRKAAENREMKKKSILTFFLLVVFLSALCGTGMFQYAHAMKPAAEYQQAEELFIQGKFEEAGHLYDTLNYKDSAEMSTECRFQTAEGLFSNRDYAAAKEAYEALGDYKSAAVKSVACDYLSLEDSSSCPNYETARSLIDNLIGEESAEEKGLISAYIQASSALAQGNIYAALLQFRDLEDFADSRDRLENCRQYYMDLALESMYRRDFETALENFACVDSPEQTKTYELYCRDRLEGHDIQDPELILSRRSFFSFENGELYYYSHAYIYVPHEIDETTSFSAYFAGGGGEPMLFMEGVFEYIEKYSPNAILVYYESSGLPDMEYSCDRMIAISNQIAAECGIVIHDLAVSGSSSGCYTALHAAAAFYTKNHVAARAMFTLDTGLDWEAELNLSAEERAATAEAGIKYYLFEQIGVGIEVPAIYDLVASGNDVTVVHCAHQDHDKMSRLAYTNGLFSWAMGEFDELKEDEYTLCPLRLTDTPEMTHKDDKAT